MLQESHDIDVPATLIQHTDNLQDESSYPYLTLLGRICSSVKANFKPNEKKAKNYSEKYIGCSHPECSFDIKLYPYSSLLQTLVCEANLKNSSDYNEEEKLMSCNRLNCIMKSLSYPLETAASSTKTSQQADTFLGIYDMTYANKLKYIAYQSAVERVQSCHTNHQTAQEIPFLLKSIYPLQLEENKNTIYSEKLKKICFQVKNQNELRSWDVSSLQSVGQETPQMNVNFETEPVQLTDCDCQLQFHYTGNESNSSYSANISINQTQTLQNKAVSRAMNKRSNIFSSPVKHGLDEERYLFEAIMKNVEAYSMMNHSYQINTSQQSADSYQSKHEYNKPNSNILQGAGIKVIEKRLPRHLKYFPKS